MLILISSDLILFLSLNYSIALTELALSRYMILTSITYRDSFPYCSIGLRKLTCSLSCTRAELTLLVVPTLWVSTYCSVLLLLLKGGLEGCLFGRWLSNTRSILSFDFWTEVDRLLSSIDSRDWAVVLALHVALDWFGICSLWMKPGQDFDLWLWVLSAQSINLLFILLRKFLPF